MTAQQEEQRAIDAKRILSDPIYKEAWQAYESRLLDEIANAGRNDEEVLRLRAFLVAARKARSHLERIMSAGMHAAQELELIEQQIKRKWWNRAA